MRAGEGLGEDLQRCEPVVCSSWSVVHAVGDAVKLVLTEDTEVRALGQVLAQQPVGVLTGAALPGAVRVAEVHTTPVRAVRSLSRDNSLPWSTPRLPRRWRAFLPS